MSMCTKKLNRSWLIQHFLPGSEKGRRILANLKKPIHCILKRLNTYLEISNLQMESPISINSVVDIND